MMNNEQSTDFEAVSAEAQELQMEATETLEDTVPEKEETVNPAAKEKSGFFCKKIIAIAVAAAAVIAILAVILIPSKFEKVEDECGQMAGRLSSGDNYFTLETFPEDLRRSQPYVVSQLAPSVRENTLKAIQYANSEFGFSETVYSQMLHTNALMGRQTAETRKYRVSWTYNADDGLVVTYEKK